MVGGYATNMLVPAMPVVMQHNKVFLGLLGLGVNATFNYPKYFSMTATGGPDPRISRTYERCAGREKSRVTRSRERDSRDLASA